MPVKLTALVAVLSLGAVGAYVAWNKYRADDQSFVAVAPSTDTASSTDLMDMFDNATDTLPSVAPTALALLFANYDSMQKSGSVSSSSIQDLGAKVAAAVKPDIFYDKISEASVHTDPDTSYQRMITYRNTLRTALKPLMDNTDAEISLIGGYEETGDESYLTKLHTAADNYRLAASNTLMIVVPSDAVTYHANTINSMREIAATLDAFANYATNTITAGAVLMSYNQAEQDVTTSFSTLAQYFTSKKP